MSQPGLFDRPTVYTWPDRATKDKPADPPDHVDWKEDPAWAFEQYDQANPWIWREFVTRCETLRSKGFQRFSARTIFESMRWEIAQSVGPDGFKINNNAIPYYAARLAKRDGFASFFERRQQRKGKA